MVGLPSGKMFDLCLAVSAQYWCVWRC